MQYRNESLDALRGFAILSMVLSGAIAFGGVLPAWMYHAQVPPPVHKFDPSIPGITWVDLVFPFFIFSMGAAMPLALKKYIDEGKGFLSVLIVAFKRFFLLVFFALFSQHMKAWVISSEPTSQDHLLSMIGFLLMFFQFFEYKGTRFKIPFFALKLFSFFVACFLLAKLPFWNGVGFQKYKSDIIILVLANMALFGTIIYYATKSQPIIRIGLLPFIMAIFLSAKEPSLSWTKTIFEWNTIGELKFDWLYKFYFLKYLFILIPGTIAGEWLLQAFQQKNTSDTHSNKFSFALIGLTFLLIFFNLYALFTRQLFLNVVVSSSIIAFIWFLLKEYDSSHLYRRMASAGAYLLLLGLFFEAYEGGIKKDTSTYSYYFVTSGLAFYCLILFDQMSKSSLMNSIIHYFALNGKNPMVAYVAGSLVLLPILNLTGTIEWYNSMNQNALMGFSRGVLFTGLVSLITIFFVKKGWYWKT
jgi:predicted acyltransferase